MRLMRHFAKLLLPLLALTVSVNMSSKSIDSYEYDFEVDSIFYTIHEDGVYVSAEKYIYKFNYTAAYYGYYNEDLSEVFSNYRGELVIPETVTFNDSVYKVVGIECFAFKGCVGLEKVYIPSSVRTIGICAFYKCSGLKEVVLPQSLNSIEYSLFNGCSELVSLVIPDSVTVIEGLAFYGCSSLKEIVVPEGIESILGSTFEYCSSLVGITLPGTLKSIGNYAFYGCSSLRELNIPEGVKSLGNSMIEKCYNLKYLTIPESVENHDIGSLFGTAHTALSPMVDKPDTINLDLFEHRNHFRYVQGEITIYRKGIGYIHSFPIDILSLPENGLFKFVIESDIDSIPDFFQYSSEWQSKSYMLERMESLYITESVKYIGTSAFCGCTNLKEVVIEGSPVIGEYAFAGCDSIERIVLSGETPPEINSNTVVSLSANVEAEDWDQSLSMVVKLDRTVPMEGASGGYASYFIEDGAFNWKISFQLDYAIPGWYDVKVKAVPNKLFPEVEDVENAEDVKPAILAVTVKYTDKDGVKQSYTRKDPSNSRKSFTFVMDGDSIMTLDAARLYLGDMKKEGERQIVTVEVQSYVSNSNAKKYSHGAWIDCLSLELVSVTDPSDVEDAYSDLEPLADEQSFSDIIRQRLLSLLFTDEVYSNAELIIPEGSLNYYMKSEIWSRFKSLSGNDLTTVLVEEGRVWHTVTLIPSDAPAQGDEQGYYKDLNGNWCKGIPHEYRLEGDTIIDDLTYKKLVDENGDFICGLYEAFSNTHTSFGAYTFNDLFFNYRTGDRVWYERYMSNVAKVARVDTIPVQGVPRKRFIIQDLAEKVVDIWIEGIGSLSGPFCSYWWWEGEPQPLLLDCTQDGVLLFSLEDLYTDDGYSYDSLNGPVVHHDSVSSNGYTADLVSDTIYYTVQPGGAMVAAREVNREKFRDNFGFDGPLTPRDPIAGGQQPRTPMRVHTMNSLGTGADTVLVNYAPYSGNLVIPESVSANDTTYRVVGTDYYAFIGCTELETVSFPESVTTLGYGSFAGCIGLKGVNIPSGVVSIPDAMFYGCTSLDGVVLPDGIVTIGHSAFYNCSGLTEIVIPASVELIDEYAFYGCTGLKRVIIEGNPEIAPTAFLGCGTGLEIIKTGIESIDTDHHEVYESVHYGTDGRPVAPDAPGLHIIRMPDGRMKKTLNLWK